jgi:hypothetical protein
VLDTLLLSALVQPNQDPHRSEAIAQRFGIPVEYFSPSWTAFQADRGRGFSVIVDGVSD